jgi:beta-N-acetylhexosaminidase
MTVIDNANRRLAAFKAQYLKPRGDLAVIRSAEHLALADAAARAGTTLLRAGSALPLSGRVGVIEYASAHESGIVEVDGLTGFSRLLRTRLPAAEVVILRGGDPMDAALALAARVDTLVLAARSAHLNSQRLEAAQKILDAAGRAVLVCLRNPYDALALHGADSVVCTCGDSAPSLAAAVAALMGDFAPTGTLPVGMQVA